MNLETNKPGSITAMIFAAGLGTRLRPLTEHTPKCLLEVGGAPILEHVIEQLYSADVDRIVVNLHHLPAQITEFLEEKLLTTK